jgi:uncharacterized lipoprotein YmbA
MMNGYTVSALAILLAACASRPVALIALPPADHALAHEPGTTTSMTTVALRPVMLPGYLDNYPVVMRRDDGNVVVSKDTEWSERLSDAVERVLRGALSQRLGPSRVVIPGDGQMPDAELTVEFLTLDPQHGVMNLDAKWTYSCRNHASQSDRTMLQVPLPDATAAGVASATSAALSQFADQLASRADCTRRAS